MDVFSVITKTTNSFKELVDYLFDRHQKSDDWGKGGEDESKGNYLHGGPFWVDLSSEDIFGIFKISYFGTEESEISEERDHKEQACNEEQVQENHLRASSDSIVSELFEYRKNAYLNHKWVTIKSQCNQHLTCSWLCPLNLRDFRTSFYKEANHWENGKDKNYSSRDICEHSHPADSRTRQEGNYSSENVEKNPELSFCEHSIRITPNMLHKCFCHILIENSGWNSRSQETERVQNCNWCLCTATISFLG